MEHPWALLINIFRLKRQQDGTFSDADLARILQNATGNPASAFKARGTPPIMRLNEIMGIEQSRRWGVCSLNDFRQVSSISSSSCNRMEAEMRLRSTLVLSVSSGPYLKEFLTLNPPRLSLF